MMGMLRVSETVGNSLELAVTLFVKFPPMSNSACVNVCVAVQVMLALTANVVMPEQSISALSLSSFKEIPVNVMFPVLVTR